MHAPRFLSVALALAASALLTASHLLAQSAPPKALWLYGGCCHDYTHQVPWLTSNLTQQIKVRFDTADNLDRLKDPNFAASYAFVVYDICFRDLEPVMFTNALHALELGKPAVIIHCGVHAFRDSPHVHDWETAIGMRSKVHDSFGPFGTEKVDPQHPILQGFPDYWATTGDELYQTIELIPDSHPLLKAKSPRDGRVHTVCWTHTVGKGRVFATTLGHDQHTSNNPDYLHLLSRGMLWASGRLNGEASPAGTK